MIFLTSLAAAILLALACVGFYLSRHVSRRQQMAAFVVTLTASVSIALVFAVALNQTWAATRDRGQRIYAARVQHLQRLQTLLRTESAALNGVAGALRDGRYFTQVANDARQAVWHDDVLTTDVERHFPEYAREREQLIQNILEHDRALGRLRQRLSADLHLPDSTEPYRLDIVSALVKKCAGASGHQPFGDEAYADPDARHAAGQDAAHAYEQYRCAPAIVAECRQLFDRADDLAEEALQLSIVARRDAEETALQGSCTYAPSE